MIARVSVGVGVGVGGAGVGGWVSVGATVAVALGALVGDDVGPVVKVAVAVLDGTAGLVAVAVAAADEGVAVAPPPEPLLLPQAANRASGTATTTKEHVHRAANHAHRPAASRMDRPGVGVNRFTIGWRRVFTVAALLPDPLTLFVFDRDWQMPMAGGAAAPRPLLA